MRSLSVLAVVVGCSGGGGDAKPVPDTPTTATVDAAHAPAPVALTTIDAAPPPPDAETIAIDVAQCPTEPVEGVAKGMAYECGAFSLRDVTSPEHVPLADLVASVTQKS